MSRSRTNRLKSFKMSSGEGNNATGNEHSLVRSSEDKVSLLVVSYFLLCLLYEGDYFVRKEALVQLCVGCVGRYKSRTGSTRIADMI